MDGFIDIWVLYNILNHTNEGQDAKAKVMCHRGDNSTHPQNSQCRITAGDDQVTGHVPKNIPALRKTKNKSRNNKLKGHKKFDA